MTTAEPSASPTALTRADYSDPTLECDVVMKGGITSGVVYPLAVCELAKTYRFRCIGGTSAGAIAAAATAAAEYGRRNGGSGFRELAELPEWLGRMEDGADRSNLFALFQPQPATDAIFDVATAALRGRSTVGRLIERFPGAALVGVIPGLIVAWLGSRAEPAIAALFLVVVGLGLAGVGALAAAGVMLARQVRTRVPRNGFGLCSGDGAGPGDPIGRPPALTPWLAELINRLAGKPAGADPLTFGDLCGEKDDEGQYQLDLRFMTTNLTHGRPYELPFASREFYYDPAELRTLFPNWVVDWMVACSNEMLEKKRAEKAEKARKRAERAGVPGIILPVPEDDDEDDDDPDLDTLLSAADHAAADAREDAARAQWRRLLPLPPPEHLPVVVAARMSLSFPLLISAVPLYAVDYMSEVADEERAPERCWFSDGGICSNFPIHFFDSPLPARPTFGINLRPFPFGREKEPDEAKNTWFPRRNNDGIVEWFARIPDGPRWASLTGFGGLIVNAMQNWVDNTQMRVPGYRDRVAHVLLTETEGGLNLNMPAEVIEDLVERGQLAARELARRFDPVHVPTGMPLTWDNHRWVRFRSSMQLLDELLRDIGDQYDAPDPSGRTYADLAGRGRGDPPSSYRLGSARRAAEVQQALEDLQALGFLHGPKPLFEEGTPRPLPELRIRPRL
jgi:predicted acylesterase/phospholipase RssA